MNAVPDDEIKQIVCWSLKYKVYNRYIILRLYVTKTKTYDQSILTLKVLTHPLSGFLCFKLLPGHFISISGHTICL